MIKCIKTNSDNPDFQKMVSELDDYLKISDGEEHSFYDQFNKIENIKFVVVAYENKIPVGCGALKKYSQDIMEIKRMFVPIVKRGKGIASVVLSELENWAKESGYKKCILETGKKQREAIGLYEKNGYLKIPNYGQYEIMENSICFEKNL